MRSSQKAFFRVTAVWISLFYAGSPLFGQTTVPFVGCVSTGQTESFAAPTGTPKSVPLSFKDATALAYYESADGPGLLAPRSWYCQGASGSGGYALLLSPKPIDHDDTGWKGLDGAAIELNRITSENSGRYEVAEIMARVFPAYRASAIATLHKMGLSFPTGPYPNDTLTYKGKTIVEYTTPAQTEGLGNFDSLIGKNELPIGGAAIVTDDRSIDVEPDIVLLSIRLPLTLRQLLPVIVHQIERDTPATPGK
jgi:hypothetical protein